MAQGKAGAKDQNARIGLRLPEALYEAIQEMADKEKRTVSQMVRILIEEAVEARLPQK